MRCTQACNLNRVGLLLRPPAEPATSTDGQTSAGVIDDTYPRFYKSAPLPVKPKEGHVTVVVGSTFNEIVLSPDKDVLLMVYSSVW